MNELDAIIKKERLIQDREALKEIKKLLHINEISSSQESFYINQYLKSHQDIDVDEAIKRVKIIEEIFQIMRKSNKNRK